MITITHHDFLNLLVPEEADGYIEIRCFNDRTQLAARQTFVKASAIDREDKIDRAIGEAMIEGYDCYMGVAERWTDDAVEGRRGGKAACAWLRALFVDIDFKMAGEAEARAKLTAFALPPSIVIRSGGGLHVYWLLKEEINTRLAEAAVVSTVKRLAAAVGGDPSATDVARVLRVPNTMNLKYATPRVVEIEVFNPEVRA